MKKILGIIILSLLFSGVAYADHLKVKLKDENQIVLQSKIMNGHEWPISEAHCAQYKKFNWLVGLMPEHGKKWSVWACSVEPITSYKGKKITWNQRNNYDPNHPWVKSITNINSTNDKITQAKQICRDLGFKTNTEKFADCALKMMSIQFEATNKVASSGGTTQEIIVKHKQDYDVWDALLDVSNVLLSDGNNSSSSSNSNSNTRCVIGKTNPMFGTTTMNCR